MSPAGLLARLAACVLCLGCTPLVHAGGQIALTFDDLPVHGPVPAGVTRTWLLTQIVGALRAAGAPEAYGFVNAASLADAEDNREALQAWRAAGLPLANHTFSHMDLHAVGTDAYRADLLANEPVLESLMGAQDWRWFRYPFLREGETAEKRGAVRELLADRGYRIAQVTVDFADWAYSAPYVRCFERLDLAAIEYLEASYLARAAASLTAAEQASRRLYGRNIRHVLLLHVGAIQPAVLPRLLELLAARGYELITLEEAQSDAAYAQDPGVVLPYGTSLLHQVSIARGLPTPDYDERELQRLEQMCR